jgi:hypothetical protein
VCTTSSTSSSRGKEFAATPEAEEEGKDLSYLLSLLPLVLFTKTLLLLLFLLLKGSEGAEGITDDDDDDKEVLNNIIVSSLNCNESDPPKSP